MDYSDFCRLSCRLYFWSSKNIIFPPKKFTIIIYIKGYIKYLFLLNLFPGTIAATLLFIFFASYENIEGMFLTFALEYLSMIG